MAKQEDVYAQSRGFFGALTRRDGRLSNAARPPGRAVYRGSPGIQVLTMVALAFILIHVGYEFELDKSKWRQYGWDYVIAMTAAAFPWILVCLYFVGIMLPSALWSD